ncbi:MAG: hypothetical protein UX85_C0008G0043 [Candidatus Beckwithbacteria bacterium GW2011_GWB1_47_15]|uniref:Cytidyltransferase-like domain-containing protein n=1 Tax=Candidatus Beckwithbacteria bacterium GW2011_GWB1_47_15 TaxID=1618371 RepID=A0A0G1RTQ2_9BACT|nr:MAG: hypothetical protein UY43_C0001G0012 [Candidatus Beckwithbacteria bacterium GW2011_GWC1_49_16]KKU34636.1 MAG: hypothetical protein UX50_C0015G0008 [Candidatus Beckwithbacteria bacterium GW2011_GWA1_46_30]KKU60669.1 MAG: hypothetical protein UX85_C0008G0043 [Candidatus Beckwithbacteria bacterium GW2011_GWB1_47_15]KKU71213.1 MAG: hypothetical protein UX97_C0010G0008 [Candidatus Beckwithbacteria bacterium GW2011_GWA2_47_25]KKW03103.1 MAG: hypothetical protein UY37_C0007G0057 [Candidatus Be
MRFRHAVVAGTFDHLHLGHQRLLSAAAENANLVSCGLTESKLSQQKFLAGLIQTPASRRQTLSRFLTRLTNRYTIFDLKDELEPAASGNFDAIIASTDTANQVEIINGLRRQRHLKSLKPVIIDLVKSSDKKILSSSRIRQGQVSRAGLAYGQIFSRRPLYLPKNLRPSLKKPFSRLLTSRQVRLKLTASRPFLTISVGDIATMSLISHGFKPNLTVVDLKTQRQQIFTSLASLGLNSWPRLTAANPPGSITWRLTQKLLESLEQLTYQPGHRVILVDGEEDLAVLPAVLLAPLTSVVIYGQPHQGLVYIKVTERAKAKAARFIQKFI